MHAYSELPPRAVANTATVLHRICNRFSESVSLKAEQWTPCETHLKFSLDSIQADLAPDCSCCFACSVGSELTLTLEWDGEARPSVHQLRLPPLGGLPAWEPANNKVKHTGLRELPVTQNHVLPQWFLTTELFGPSACDILSGMSGIPEALLQVGCKEQALKWTQCPPCETGPCTVFACKEIDHVCVSSFTVPEVAIFLHGNNVAGREQTVDGGSLQYSCVGNVLKLVFRGTDGRPKFRADLFGQQRFPIRTKERQRIVYVVPSIQCISRADVQT